MNSYRLKKERERLLFSALSVLGSIVVVLLLSWILDLFRFEDFSDYSGPVKITFGSELSEVESDVVVPEPVIEEPETVERVEELTPIVEEPVVPEPTQPKEVTETIEEPVIDRVEEVTPEVVKPVKPPEPIVKKGRESGNSHETSFDSSSSEIGRTAYFPIADYMPLPKSIPIDTYALITGDITGFGEKNYNRNFFERYYMKSGSVYELIDSVNYQQRPDLWAILKQAGYDIDRAEYKQQSLNTVVVIFEIEKSSDGSFVVSSAEIEKSSGVAEIDDAVLYGFRKSTYSNSTDTVVKGRFKYSFSR